MHKSISMFCLVLGLALCTSGCTNMSKGSRNDDSHRKVGTVLNDATITANVKAKFVTDDEVKAFTINVDTYQGVVTLSGTVPNQQALNRAVKLAKETDGVRQVISKLTIR
jgi:hyperosmotically inducible periplasmic protein